MTRILLSGCGRMGKLVADEAANFENLKTVYGVDSFLPDGLPFPVVADFESVDVPFDVIVDYSNPANFDSLLHFALAQKKPLVLCTTGLNEEMRQKVFAAAKEIPIFFSANMSLGIYVLTAVAKAASKMLGAGFDIEVQEAHHRNKLDAPSGTALQIAEALLQERDDLNTIVTDRYSSRQKRGDDEIGVSSLRGGSIPGQHTVTFAGPDEVIELTHTAYSPRVFATGALRAAAFLKDQAPGIYDMSHLLGL